MPPVMRQRTRAETAFMCTNSRASLSLMNGYIIGMSIESTI
jgi:hypothetical protein